MSSSEVGLGNVEYLYLRNIDCNNSVGADDATEFVWNLPYIQQHTAPIMYIEIVQLYLDYGAGATADANKVLPQVLTLENYMGQNFYSTGGNSTQIASFIVRDALGGHWFSQQDSPMIQVPSNLRQLKFYLHHTVNWNQLQVGNDASLDILIKISRPKQMELTDNMVKAFVPTIPRSI